MITTEQVKELRDATGISIMQCKKALEEAAGDMEKALMILKKKSSEVAAKKGDRDLASGIVVTASNGDKTVGLVLQCETDFVAKNDEFIALANTLAQKVLVDGADAATAAASDLINPLIQKIGENMKVGDVVVYEGTVGVYVHNARSGAFVSVDARLNDGVGQGEGDAAAVAKDIAMHVAAMKPTYLAQTDVPADMRTKASDLFAEEVKASGKPADIQEKMLAGKIDAYFKEQTLLDQSFIKNPNQTIGQLAKEKGVTVKAFALLRAAA